MSIKCKQPLFLVWNRNVSSMLLRWYVEVKCERAFVPAVCVWLVLSAAPLQMWTTFQHSAAPAVSSELLSPSSQKCKIKGETRCVWSKTQIMRSNYLKYDKCGLEKSELINEGEKEARIRQTTREKRLIGDEGRERTRGQKIKNEEHKLFHRIRHELVTTPTHYRSVCVLLQAAAC